MSATAPSKRLFIKTYGCQMNVYDSERMADVLSPLGYAMTDTPEGADLVVLNTCHIREKATEKVYSELGKLKEMREERLSEGGSRMTIAVAGCVAQAEGEEIMRRQPAVDLVVGPQAYHQLPELIARTHRARGERLSADFAPDEKFDALPARRPTGVTAFLTVQEGCDKFCTFCVVPYTRGGEYSRPPTRSWPRPATWPPRACARSPCSARTSTPTRARAAWRPGPAPGEDRGPRPHPLHHQPSARHGRRPDRRPRRGGRADALSAPARAVRARTSPQGHEPGAHRRQLPAAHRADPAARPDIAISGDFIVGFPGERDSDFEATLALVREVGHAGAFSFKYSRRPAPRPPPCPARSPKR
jgi:tRNA-2-methylthio-N6-dimethylallyladenosine synthase